MSDLKIIAALQEQVSFLENALQELSDEHFAQQQEVRELQARVEYLIQRTTNQNDAGDLQSDINLVDERPPHY